MKPGLVVPEPGELAADLGIAIAGHDLEATFYAVVAIPRDQRRDVRRESRAQADDAVEAWRRKVSRHQRHCSIGEFPVGDADRIAGDPLEDLEARQRVGGLDLQGSLHLVERGRELPRLHRDAPRGLVRTNATRTGTHALHKRLAIRSRTRQLMPQ